MTAPDRPDASDAELAERLARTLRAKASSVTSSPDAWADLVAAGNVTAAPQTVERRFRAAVPVGVVGAAAAVVVGLLVLRTGRLGPGTHLATAGSHSSAASTAAAAGPGAAAGPSQASAAQASDSPNAPPGWSHRVAGPAGGPVPTGFSPASVTFVSLQEGWALGTAPCATAPCTSIVRTIDGGATWSGIPAPKAALTAGPGAGPGMALQAGGVGTPLGVGSLRFADPLDGWAFGPGLWSTHDGGATWHLLRLPGTTDASVVVALEAPAGTGVVHAVVLDGHGTFRMETSAVTSDTWEPAAVAIPGGAGPAPTAQLVVSGRSGWVIVVNRTVVGGARLVDGRWATWKPPCSEGGGPAHLAASSPVGMAAVCDVGIATGTGASPQSRAVFSTDGGATFAVAPSPVGAGPHGADSTVSGPSSIGPASSIGSASSIASAGPSMVVIGTAMGSSGVLDATFDGGHTWAVVYRGASVSWEDVGFTSPSQGVAVNGVTGDGGGALLMTRDGGRTWHPVTFSEAHQGP